jgi:hypothetical protein
MSVFTPIFPMFFSFFIVGSFCAFICGRHVLLIIGRLLTVTLFFGFEFLVLATMTRDSPQDMIKMAVARDYLDESISKDPDPVLTPMIKAGMKAGVRKVPRGRLKAIGAGVLVSGPGTEAQNVSEKLVAFIRKDADARVGYFLTDKYGGYKAFTVSDPMFGFGRCDAMMNTVEFMQAERHALRGANGRLVAENRRRSA